MNTDSTNLKTLVETFALDWLRLGEPDFGEHLLSDPILVLGPDGTSAVPRQAFLAAVASRADAVEASTASQTSLADVSVQALGERMVLATTSWTFRQASATTTLVSDVLLERAPSGALRCVAYLPRTNVLDHVGEGPAA